LGKPADDAHEAVLYLLQKQHRGLYYVRSKGQAGHIQQKLIDGEVPIGGRKLSVKVNFEKAESRYTKIC
jgi:hypothetical protein